MKPTKIYTFSVSASGSYPLLVEGEFFKIIRATGDIEVRGDSFGTIGLVLPGQGLTNTPFKRLEIKDRSGSANLVSLIVADQAFVDDRIAGEVSVIDGNKARAVAGAAFGWRPTAYGGATTRANSQLWNPVGSGVRVIVDGIMVGTSAQAEMAWGISNVQLASAAIVPTLSMLSGAAVSNAVGRSELTTGFIAMSDLGAVTVAAFGSFEVGLKRPVVLMPGTGLCLVNGAISATLAGSVQFFEESIL